MTKYVYDFAEGGRDMVDLLGGKGANLAEMTVLGLPVPPGFVITTEACRTYLRTGTLPRVWTQRSRSTCSHWRPRWASGSATRTTPCW